MQGGNNVWQIIEKHDGHEVKVGAMLMYVDDVLVLSTTDRVLRVLKTIQAKWKMDIKGMLVRDQYKTEHEVPELRFL